jgi:5'-3' exonuclease/transcription antitermination factor NusG
VVLQLTSKGDKENPVEVRRAIVKSLRGADVYIPAVETQIGDDTVTHYLVKGYAFIRHTFEDRAYFKLDNTRYVEAVLPAPGSTASRRKVATVENSYIESMQEKIRVEVNQGICVGDTVRICSGPYKHITAKVITEIPEEKQVQVHVQLRSKEAILTLPRSVLDVVDRAPYSHYHARMGYLRAWAQMAAVVLKYDAPLGRLLDTHRQYQRVYSWLTQGGRLYAYIHSDGLGALKDRLVQGRDILLQFESWVDRGRKLSTFLYQDQVIPNSKLAEIQSKYSKVEWLRTVEQRLAALSQGVEEIARSQARGKKVDGEMTVQNVLIDGFNLSFRCFFAPGMGDLTDSQGRHTGVIFGFLRGVGALKKRYPEANFWVVWDGSSQRRKSKYPDYKAQRVNSDRKPVFDQIAEIRRVLPLLGVRQAWNPVEEADDVIGTLVRGELQAQTNIIFSTDHDFMQLVTEKTQFLFPAVGSRREVLFDRDAVKEHLGVFPEKAVELRAFFGDTSDNIPGVPRVPKKVLRSLLQVHGSAKGVYASGLAGLTKVQYERLRAAESQVKINLDLMSLVDVDVTKIDPDVDVESAIAALRGLEIRSEPIIEAFFGQSKPSPGA